MARYQVILAYDGTEFQGFQRQTGTRTVQSVVETALERLGWQERAILAAGRTDTGVHAEGQVIAFELAWNHSVQALQAALNANLPPDVAARAVYPAAADFHPRYNAVARRYRYRLFCQDVRHPLWERYAWRVWPAADFERLQQAASYLVGTHDFAAFGTPPRVGGSTIRSVSQANWQASDPGLVFEIEANAFLYHMVRRLVNFLVEVGQGRSEPEAVIALLAQNSRSQSSGSWEGPPSPPVMVQGLAPPQGLSLVEVRYPPGCDDHDATASPGHC